MVAAAQRMAAAAAAQGDAALLSGDSHAAAAAPAATLAAAVGLVTDALAGAAAAEGLVVVLVEPAAAAPPSPSPPSPRPRGAGLGADVASFQALAVRVAALGPDDAAVRTALGLPPLQTAALAATGTATVVLVRVASTAVAALVEGHWAPAPGQWALGGGGVPAGLAAAVEASQRAVLVALQVASPQGGVSAAAAAAATVAVADLSLPGFLGDYDGSGGSGGGSSGEVLYAGAELGSLRGLGWLKRACRPAVVAFGRSAAFDAVMQAPSVRQLLLFDTFVDPEEVRIGWTRCTMPLILLSLLK